MASAMGARIAADKIDDGDEMQDVAITAYVMSRSIEGATKLGVKFAKKSAKAAHDRRIKRKEQKIVKQEQDEDYDVDEEYDAEQDTESDTRAEVVIGSTRLEAGTSQKLILNMLSTGAMIKSGYVYENLMVNLRATNIKLKKRMINIVCDVTKVFDVEAERYLECADWYVRKAIELVEGKRNCLKYL